MLLCGKLLRVSSCKFIVVSHQARMTADAYCVFKCARLLFLMFA